MSRTIKRTQSLPAADASRAAASFDKLAARLNSTGPADRTQPNVDLQDAGTAAIGVLAHLATNEIHPRLVKLAGAGEFRMDALDELELYAWAAIHIRRKLLLKLGTNSAVQIPAEIEKPATEVRDRMAALCRYYFSDHAELAPTIAFLAQGSGYLDLANDLEGYADIYRDQHAVVARDPKYYRPGDANAAREAAQTIYKLLGVGTGGNEPDWGSLQGAIWPLLTRTYDEIRRVGRFLCYYDDGDTRFPSLVTAARATPKSSSADKTDAQPGTPATPNEPKP